MAKRGNRDEIVLATKFTIPYQMGHNVPIPVNTAGNSVKSMRNSVEQSLKRLQTDYIDILYVHMWDYTTSIPELMFALNQLVLAGKVLYLAISDSPAWVVAKANEYARSKGFKQFSIYQGRWSAALRDFERDIIPMARDEGMALAPWDALGGGRFKTEEQIEEMKARGEQGRAGEITENDRKATAALDKIGKEIGKPITSVALAYVMAKTTNVFPIIGGRKVEHLKGNIDALTIRLTPEQIKAIDDATDFEIGFPHSFIGTKAGEALFVNLGGRVTYLDPPKSLNAQ